MIRWLHKYTILIIYELTASILLIFIILLKLTVYTVKLFNITIL